MTITLHHCMSARSFRPLWTLEELELPHELVLLPFPPRVHRRDYLAVNPLGTVPAFFDGDVRMTESSAICQYLVTRYGPTPLNVGPEEADYGAFLNGLYFGEATLTFPQTIVLRYGRFEPPESRLPRVAEDYTRWFLARLRAIEPLVADAPHLCAGRFTAADISVGYALMLADHIGLAPRFPPSVGRYWTALQERPAFRRALERQTAAAIAQGVPTTPSPQVLP